MAFNGKRNKKNSEECGPLIQRLVVHPVEVKIGVRFSYGPPR